MPITINNAVRVLLRFTINGAFLGETHMDFVQASEYTHNHENAQTLVEDIGAAITAGNVNDAWGSDVRVPLFTVHNFDNPNLADIDITSELAGVETGDPLPYNTAALVKLTTGFSGRSNRGRMYVPGYTEASSDGAAVNSTTRNNLTDLFPAINTAVGADFVDMTLGVLSMKNETGHVATSITCEPSWATMRKRLSRLR